MLYHITIVNTRGEETLIQSGVETHAIRWTRHALCRGYAVMVTEGKQYIFSANRSKAEQDRAEEFIMGETFCSSCKRARAFDANPIEPL